jgi:hypothetical protein
MPLQLFLTLMMLIMQVIDLLGLRCLEIHELMRLHSGGFLCLTQEAAVPK